MFFPLALLVPIALAGEVQVNMDTPVLIYINGAQVPNPTAILQVTARDLPGGPAVVEVRNLLGRVVVQTTVTVPADQQLRMRYTRKELQILGTSPLPPAPVVVATSTQTSTQTGTVTYGPVAIPASPSTGSLEIVGFDNRTGSVWVDGLTVPYVAKTDNFPATGLSVGPHSVRIESERQLRYDGTLQVGADQNTHCLVAPLDKNNALNCFFARPALVSSGATRSSFPAEGTPPARTPPVSTTPTAPAAPPVAAVPAGPVEVVFVLKDTMDMCNVYIDGARVAEFRTGDAEKRAVVSPGVHTVEIRDFTEFDTWHKGLLTVSGSDPMRVGFGEDEPVEVYNRSGAWQPK